MQKALAFLAFVAVVVFALPDGDRSEQGSDTETMGVSGDGAAGTRLLACFGLCTANGTFGVRAPICLFGHTAFPDTLANCNCCVLRVTG